MVCGGKEQTIRLEAHIKLKQDVSLHLFLMLNLGQNFKLGIGIDLRFYLHEPDLKMSIFNQPSTLWSVHFNN